MLAVLGLIPFLGILFALAALILGALGETRIRRRADLKGAGWGFFGLIVGSLKLAVNLALTVWGIQVLRFYSNSPLSGQ